MKKTKKVFLPKWMRYWIIPLFILIAGLVLYEEYVNPASKGELGNIGSLIFVGIFASMLVVFWLMTSGKLPSYIIEEESEEEK